MRVCDKKLCLLVLSKLITTEQNNKPEISIDLFESITTISINKILDCNNDTNIHTIIKIYQKLCFLDNHIKSNLCKVIPYYYRSF